MGSDTGLAQRQQMRWFAMAAARLTYRWWTRLAVAVFPYGTARAALAARVGIPLPDRLNLSWITPNLAVGGRIRSGDIHVLVSMGITSVVDTRIEDKDDEAALASAGIRLLHLPAPDTSALSLKQLQGGAVWINSSIAAGHRVLVHCEHGVGRSVMLATAALMANGRSAKDALEELQHARWQAAPNAQQIKQLLAFEEHLSQSVQWRLVAETAATSPRGD